MPPSKQPTPGKQVRDLPLSPTKSEILPNQAPIQQKKSVVLRKKLSAILQSPKTLPKKPAKCLKVCLKWCEKSLKAWLKCRIPPVSFRREAIKLSKPSTRLWKSPRKYRTPPER